MTRTRFKMMLTPQGIYNIYIYTHIYVHTYIDTINFFSNKLCYKQQTDKTKTQAL